jgi:hypothetical protein
VSFATFYNCPSSFLRFFFAPPGANINEPDPEFSICFATART